MKHLMKLFLIAPFLVGCGDKPYDGPKISLPYQENGDLVESNPKEMFDNAYTLMKDSIYMVGDDMCESCKHIKEQLKAWSINNHCYIYYIPLTSIEGEENINYMKTATSGGPYQWSEEQSVPVTYFFMTGSVMMKGTADNTISYLKKYVTVIS